MEMILSGGRSVGETLYIVIWSLFIGIVIGVGMGIYQKGVLGSLVRHLLEKRATSPDTALTMDEAGLTKNRLIRWLIRRAVRGESSYGKIVSPAPDDLSAPMPKDGEKPAITDGTKFYIPPEMNDRAVMSFSNSGNIVVWGLLSVAAFLVVALASFYVVPALTDMFKNIVG